MNLPGCPGNCPRTNWETGPTGPGLLAHEAPPSARGLSPQPGLGGPLPERDVAELARRVALQVARELGADEAARLLPTVVRALAGCTSEAADMGLRQELIRSARRLADLGFMTGTAGNLSVRESASTLLITGAGFRKGELGPHDLVRLDMAGNPVGSGPAPSSEFRVHLAVYRARPDVQAIVHTHPPVATSFAAAGIPLDQPVLAEAVSLLGPVVPLVPFAPPSTWELVRRLEPWLPGHQAFLLANHGVLCLGSTLAEAVQRNETLEFLARVLLAARQLGGGRPLGREDLQALSATAASPQAPHAPGSTSSCPASPWFSRRGAAGG